VIGDCSTVNALRARDRPQTSFSGRLRWPRQGL